jgi:hypothetical protein
MAHGDEPDVTSDDEPEVPAYPKTIDSRGNSIGKIEDVFVEVLLPNTRCEFKFYRNQNKPDGTLWIDHSAGGSVIPSGNIYTVEAALDWAIEQMRKEIAYDNSCANPKVNQAFLLLLIERKQDLKQGSLFE